MTLALTFAGIKQVELQRIAGESYMDTQDQLALFYWVRLGTGFFVLVAAILFIASLFLPARRKVAELKAVPQPAE
jgi:nitric oxide reductase subunit B